MTDDEMQNAIEFLLKNQANFEVQLEKTNRQIEQTERQLEKTDRQLELTNLLVSSLADTQAVFMQTVTRQVEAQGEINAGLRQAIGELTKTVGDLARAVYKNGNPPQS